MLNSWKRLASLASLMALLALSLSGCIHADRAVSLNSDGSGTYSLTIGYSEQLISLAGDQLATSMDNYGAQVKQAGGSYRHYDDTGYSYWAYTRPFKTIAQLNQLIGQNPQLGTSDGSLGSTAAATQDTINFSEQSSFLSNSFHVTGHMSLAAPQGMPDPGTVDPTTGIDYSQYLKDIRESFAVTMPGSVTAHKGGVVNGNTVTYTIHYGEQTDIDVTGGGLNTALLLPLGGGAVVVLALVVAGVIVMSRLRRKPVAEPVAVAVPMGYGAGFEYPTVPSASQPTQPEGPARGSGQNVE